MKAIQIVMKGNERSEEYAYLSQRSFQRAIDDGYIDSIETFDAITPEIPDFQESYVSKYSWAKSLMTLDTLSGNGKDDSLREHRIVYGYVLHGQIIRSLGSLHVDTEEFPYQLWPLLCSATSFQNIHHSTPRTS